MNILKLVEGIFSIGVGVAGFFYILKHPIPKEEDTNLHMLYGYGGAFGFIILGIVMVIDAIKSA
jgi:hypothetical protein